ncbi:hypothetical protein QE364_001514 [Nocardioides zeae]|uniref:Uncharacterized protein n=1 Tax=Nocardioides zeae TaxID=1457234 RepID=A0ACC6IGM9_9ACTN|nr:hypothetical protein [Nocardioides zeae]MDR6172804.1 hypothetical protein [Nocardioides zeae]MDR6209814.1 hypothetical protein [Nocardioides zeae]
MMRSRPALLAAVLTAGPALVLAGCGGSDGSDGADGPEGAGGDGGSTVAVPPPSAPTSAAPALPDGVTTTAAGTELGLGEQSTVAWQVGADRQAVVDLTVVGVQPAPLELFDGWLLNGVADEVAPYFVTYAVENVGDNDLAAAAMPLFLGYGAEGALVAASGFAATFEPCPSTPLPTPFEPGAATEGCLVYLAPSDQPVTAVAFQATGDVAPVTWGSVAPR